MKKVLTALLVASLLFPNVNSLADSSRKEIYLTIDDGPKQNTEEILNSLGEENKATFFMLGEILETKQGFKRALKVLEKGHQIGNHSYSHPEFSKINLDSIKKEIIKTKNLIYDLYEEVGRENPLLFRFPYGDSGFYQKKGKDVGFMGKKDKIINFLELQGYRIVGWNLDSEDWKYYSSNKKSLDKILENLNYTKKGDTILVHDLRITSKNLIPFYILSEKYLLKSIK